MKKLMLILLLGASTARAQELFVYTEPASNMPARSLGLRVTSMLMNEKYVQQDECLIIPELMWGAGKNLMVHVNGFASNQSGVLRAEGGSVYAKYRFLSNDAVHSHFRMAGYAKLSFNSSAIHQEEIDLYGHNSGWQAGVVATQLLHKIALSANLNYARAMDNGQENKYPETQSANAASYAFSFGKLMLPKTYTSYKQTNLNLMLELLGQVLGDGGKSYLDIAPSVQLIVNSQARIELGYRRQLYSTMLRTAPDGFLFRVEYLLFNVFR